jgi:aminodeoxyfutalosine deaminase
MILAARYVAPVDGPVIEQGAIRIERATIGAVGTAKAICMSGNERVNFGDAVITPGFVNAHTHLELSHLAGRVPPSSDFTGWLRRLVDMGVKFPPTKGSVQQVVAEGIAQSLSAGVTTVGDITRFPAWSREALSQSDMRAVSFGEVIAIGARRHLLRERLNASLCTEYENDFLRCGVSPHAPYTVEPDALRECAMCCTDRRVPMAIHVAETLGEVEFTHDRTGVFADHLRTLGVWDDDIPISGLEPIPLIESSGLLTKRTVLAHANYVSDDDIELIAKRRASVAYCPRTHAAFEHPPHRFRDMLRAGVNVCIGTDSLASNPTLSILDELRFLRHEYPEMQCERLLEMGTLSGAKALGLEKSVGSITAGNEADLVVIPLSRDGDWREALDSMSEPIAVLSRGCFVVDNR